MKPVLAVVLCVGQVLLCGAASQEENACYESPHAIRSWVDLTDAPDQVSFLANVFCRSGDRMAVAIVHAFGEKELVDPERTKRVVRVLRAAFSEPTKISRSEDADPAVTYLLLAYLEQRQKAPTVLDEIVKARESIAAAMNANKQRTVTPAK